MSTPSKTVKDKFESKEKLVAAVEKFITDELWLPRLSSDRGGSRGLKHVSNAKLLRLHETFSAVQKQFKTRSGLVDAVLEAEGRNKDGGYKSRLETYPVPRLYDLYRAKARKAAKTKS